MLKEILGEFISWYMSKDDAINKMNGSNLIDKRSVLYIQIYIFIINKNEGEY